MKRVEGANMPAAARHLGEFPAFARGFDFPSAPDQTIAFLAAVELLGPRNIHDVKRAALATLAPPPERLEEFDALFRAWFYGEAAPVLGASEEQEEVEITDEGGAIYQPPETPEMDESGQSATASEMLATRAFDSEQQDLTLRRFAREAPQRLPRRAGFRRTQASRGRIVDLRRALRASVRHGGDTPQLPWLRRKSRHRRILVLIDVSGSMKAHTDSTLRFAHALYHAAERVECFTIGTRLTRTTPALRLRRPEQALTRASSLVADWDGGTRLGDALHGFLSVPRFLSYARGALVLVLSDGLERGEPDRLVMVVKRLSRLAWRLNWLTPLAADASFRPQTQALQAIVPFLDDLDNGATTAALCRHILDMGQWKPRGFRYGATGHG